MKKILGIAALMIALIFLLVAANSVEAATIGGLVLSARGDAVAGALVTIQQVDVPRGQRAYAARVQSGRDGRFQFNGIPGGRYIVAAQTRTSAVRTQTAVRQDGAVRVRLVLPGRDGLGIMD